MAFPNPHVSFGESLLLAFGCGWVGKGLGCGSAVACLPDTLRPLVGSLALGGGGRGGERKATATNPQQNHKIMRQIRWCDVILSKYGYEKLLGATLKQRFDSLCIVAEPWSLSITL